MKLKTNVNFLFEAARAASRVLGLVVLLALSQGACARAQMAPRAGQDASAAIQQALEPAAGSAQVEAQWAMEASLYADDSFLVEEALQRMSSHTWDRAESRELPLATGDRIVWTVPQTSDPHAPSLVARGDLSVEYRFVRALGENGEMSPRVALLLPTADASPALGGGALGVQAQLPVVWRFSRRFDARVSLGATWVPGQAERLGARADTFGFSGGARLVYHPADNVDVSLEALYSHGQSVNPGGGTSVGQTLFVSPGLRFSMKQRDGGEIVPGIAFPIGVGPSAVSAGVFVYLCVKR